MGYDLRYIFFTHKAVYINPTPRKRLCIERNRHRSRAQYALDEEDVVACVLRRCLRGAIAMLSRGDGVSASWSRGTADAIAAAWRETRAAFFAP